MRICQLSVLENDSQRSRVEVCCCYVWMYVCNRLSVWLHNECVIIISAPPSRWWCHTRAPSGLSGDTSISGWGLSQTQLIMVQWECLLTWLPTCQCVCAWICLCWRWNGWCVWFEFCGLPVSWFSIFCSIFMPFCFIKLLNVYGAYIFVSAVWSMCFIIREILTP